MFISSTLCSTWTVPLTDLPSCKDTVWTQFTGTSVWLDSVRKSYIQANSDKLHFHKFIY